MLIFTRKLQWKQNQHYRQHNYPALLDFSFLLPPLVGIFGTPLQSTIALQQALKGKSDILCRTQPTRSALETIGCDCFASGGNDKCFAGNATILTAETRICSGFNATIVSSYPRCPTLAHAPAMRPHSYPVIT